MLVILLEFDLTILPTHCACRYIRQYLLELLVVSLDKLRIQK